MRRYNKSLDWLLAQGAGSVGLVWRLLIFASRWPSPAHRECIVANKSQIAARPRPKDYFTDWKKRESLAEAMIPLVGQMYRHNNIHSYIYGQPLVNQSVLDIMRAHRFVRLVEGNELSEFETFPVLAALAAIKDLGSAEIDVGRITILYEEQGKPAGHSVAEFVRAQVQGLIGSSHKPIDKPRDVVLYGFGRIGRLVARLLIEKTAGGDTLRLRAIVVRKGDDGDLAKRAGLMRRDSVHGAFPGTIRIDEEHQSFVANGNEVRVIYADQPDAIDYRSYGIDDAIIVDNTGQWRSQEALGRHLHADGVSQVLLTAPAKSGVKNIVHGVNQHLIDSDESLVSASSCTTNAVTLLLHAVHDRFGIEGGHIETVHAYTNDQNLIDNYHPAPRRGRSAATNLVLTDTGAAQAVGAILPELAGKLSGHAIRVPVPNVSLAVLQLRLRETVNRESLNEHMRHIALHSPLRRQIGYTNSTEIVSSDIVGSREACVLDSVATIAENGHECVLYGWYDNEFGYACQVYRLLEELAGVCYPICPSDG